MRLQIVHWRVDLIFTVSYLQLRPFYNANSAAARPHTRAMALSRCDGAAPVAGFGEAVLEAYGVVVLVSWAAPVPLAEYDAAPEDMGTGTTVITL